MRRILFMFLAFMLIFSVTSAFAGEGCGEKAAVKAGDGKSCCAGKQMKAGTAAKTVSVSQEDAKEAEQGCPDVSTRTALMDFHEAMHPMHVALGASDFSLMREGLSDLVKASKGVKAYKCDGYEQCSKECRKNFDGKKKALLNAVNDLKKACKGKDDQKVADKFDVMHEAYITFANACVHEEKPEGRSERSQ